MTTPFVCPVCGGALAVAERSLTCANQHVFDVARQGYVNLLTKKPENLYEDKGLFEARRLVYGAGFFAPVCAAIEEALPGGTVLDAGCGEGSTLAAVLGARRGIGLDIAKAAVRMAAGAYKGIDWCVGDLCAIPLADASVDAVMNMLTPANYGEFARILRPGGRLVKVVPGPGHLRQIREMAGKAEYTHTMEETLAVFEKRFSLLERRTIAYDVACDADLAAQVFRMTPLTAHEALPQALPDTVSVEVTLLVGEVLP